ncbi:MAG: hypothetical protein H6Q89_1802 [Myxococcaceae bacterium]|nr:hypothetical protein [Myxococcaceae bacterium]
MRGTTVVVGLMAIAAYAADGGAAKAPGKAAVDAGAATVDAGSPLGWRAKPVLLFTDDPAVVEKYALAKPHERAAIKGVLTKLTVGKRAAGAILLENYDLPFSRRVDLAADVVITDPTGRVVLDKAGIAGAQTMDPKTMVLVPLTPTFGMMFGLTDPEGEYKVRVVVWDQVRGASAVLETKFLVTR